MSAARMQGQGGGGSAMNAPHARNAEAVAR